MSLPYTVAAAARADLADIYRYTAQRWGIQQADLYQASLTERFLLIAEQPLMGTARNMLGKGVRVHQAESHMVYYRVRRGEVEFLRVLHVRQDAQHAFRRR